eukprot:TRINITY_DN13355_c0_g1_i25.p1 TRINITY_DN13355_c0_g1~~TRINITY_DN13355_c0_g1_i25.p1  ORF type:complete len:1255 (+),score=233.77 TRINITY_DN13355_c0_g1_i25:52-3816(+)
MYDYLLNAKELDVKKINEFLALENGDGCAVELLHELESFEKVPATLCVSVAERLVQCCKNGHFGTCSCIITSLVSAVPDDQKRFLIQECLRYPTKPQTKYHQKPQILYNEKMHLLTAFIKNNDVVGELQRDVIQRLFQHLDDMPDQCEYGGPQVLGIMAEHNAIPEDLQNDAVNRLLLLARKGRRSAEHVAISLGKIVQSRSVYPREMISDLITCLDDESTARPAALMLREIVKQTNIDIPGDLCQSASQKLHLGLQKGFCIYSFVTALVEVAKSFSSNNNNVTSSPEYHLNQSVINSLLQQLKDDEKEVRRSAEMVFNYIANAGSLTAEMTQSVIETQLQQLKDDEKEVRRSAEMVFDYIAKAGSLTAEMTQSVIETQLQQLKDDEKEVRGSAEKVIGIIAEAGGLTEDTQEVVVQQLFQIFERDNLKSALLNLSKRDSNLNQIITQRLISYLQDRGNEEIRVAAADALEQILSFGTHGISEDLLRQIAQGLLTCFKDESRKLRYSAAKALSQLTSRANRIPEDLQRSVFQAVLLGLEEEDKHMWVYCGATLAKMSSRNENMFQKLFDRLLQLPDRFSDWKVACIRDAADLDAIPDTLRQTVLVQGLLWNLKSSGYAGGIADVIKNENLREEIVLQFTRILLDSLKEMERKSDAIKLKRWGCKKKPRIPVREIEQDVSQVTALGEMWRFGVVPTTVQDDVLNALVQALLDYDEEVAQAGAAALVAFADGNPTSEKLEKVVRRLLPNFEEEEEAGPLAAEVVARMTKTGLVSEGLRGTVVEELFRAIVNENRGISSGVTHALGEMVEGKAIPVDKVSDLKWYLEENVRFHTGIIRETGIALGQLVNSYEEYRQPLVKRMVELLNNEKKEYRRNSAIVLEVVGCAGLPMELRQAVVKGLSQAVKEDECSNAAANALAKAAAVDEDLRQSVIMQLVSIVKGADRNARRLAAPALRTVTDDNIPKGELLDYVVVSELISKSSRYPDDPSVIKKLGEVATTNTFPDALCQDVVEVMRKRFDTNIGNSDIRCAAASVMGAIAKSRSIPKSPEACMEMKDENTTTPSSRIKRQKVDLSIDSDSGQLEIAPRVTVHDLNWKGALHHAVINKDSTKVLQLLLAQEVDVNAREHGLTALHLASAVGDSSSALALIQAEADVNARDARGQTPLHLSVINGRSDVVELLLNWRSVDIGAVDNQGLGVFYILSATLHSAASEGRSDVVELLLVRGADPEVLDFDGKTALQLAQAGGHTDTAALLTR